MMYGCPFCPIWCILNPLLHTMKNELKPLVKALHAGYLLGFIIELIQHRFTKTSKRIIEERYPKSKLEMDIAKRKTKWGRCVQYKYVYPDDQQRALRELITISPKI